MNKTFAIIAFGSLFIIGLTFILMYVQLYDDYVAAIVSGKSYIIFLMAMAGLSILIVILIAGWLTYEMLEENKNPKEALEEEF